MKTIRKFETVTPGKFRNKYRISSSRLQKWDYRWPAAYFITICTHNRDYYFGNIENGIMKLSPTGIIADILWHEIKSHSPNVDPGPFIVMPNHIHGILILNENDLNDSVETLHATSLREQQHHTEISKNDFMSNISPKSNSISTIIRSYKSAVSKNAHRLGFNFEWQTRFYDRIIRDEKSFNRIQKYILENPMKWSDDQFFQ